MSVGVMKDYKLKQRNLRASHTLGLVLELEHLTVGEELFFPVFFFTVFASTAVTRSTHLHIGVNSLVIFVYYSAKHDDVHNIDAYH